MGINQYIQIGSKIKEARLAKGIKQNKMAERLGVSVSTYSNYENNYREPKLDLIHQICDILDIEIDDLLGISQFDSNIADQIYNHLLSDDIDAVKKQLSSQKHTIVIDTRGMENHPYEKFRRGEKLTPEEEEELQLYFDEAIKAIPNIFKEFGNKLKEHYQLLNEKGQQRAKEQLDRTLEQIEMLTKIPEYQRKEEN